MREGLYEEIIDLEKVLGKAIYLEIYYDELGIDNEQVEIIGELKEKIRLLVKEMLKELNKGDYS